MPYRCDDLDCQHLRLMGDLGQACLRPWSHAIHMVGAVQWMRESLIDATMAVHACGVPMRGSIAGNTLVHQILRSFMADDAMKLLQSRSTL